MVMRCIMSCLCLFNHYSQKHNIQISPRCQKHHQQRYHNEITIIYMFIHSMYVDILFLLTKAIPIIFEGVTNITKLCKYGQAIIQRVTITSTRYHMRCSTFSLSLAWFGAICNRLLRVTVNFTKKCTLLFLKKMVATRCK